MHSSPVRRPKQARTCHTLTYAHAHTHWRYHEQGRHAQRAAGSSCCIPCMHECLRTSTCRRPLWLTPSTSIMKLAAGAGPAGRTQDRIGARISSQHPTPTTTHTFTCLGACTATCAVRCRSQSSRLQSCRQRCWKEGASWPLHTKHWPRRLRGAQRAAVGSLAGDTGGGRRQRQHVAGACGGSRRPAARRSSATLHACRDKQSQRPTHHSTWPCRHRLGR